MFKCVKDVLNDIWVDDFPTREAVLFILLALGFVALVFWWVGLNSVEIWGNQ